jgi:hypothetical protein
MHPIKKFTHVPTEAEMASVASEVDANIDAELGRVAGRYWPGLTQLPDVGLGESAAAALVVYLFALLWACRLDTESPAGNSGVDVAAVYRGFLLRQNVDRLRAGLSLKHREDVFLPVLAKMWQTEAACASEGLQSKLTNVRSRDAQAAGFDNMVGELIRPEIAHASP